ncbi:MAG: GntR family transcriptional regulator [Gammaproteobacteria bacterium]|nr:GntR family transcriptional regulator [Gammaproteobacteria bacterium]
MHRPGHPFMANDGDNGRRTPRYRELADALIGDISSGRIGIGERLPGEIALTRQFSVSRHTVREALRVLEELGLVGRRPGVGTVVRHADVPATPNQRLLSLTELLRYPGETQLSVIGSRELRVDARLARLLAVPAGESRWHISALRRCRDSEVPFCWTDVYLLPAYSAVAGMIGQDSRPVYRLVEERFGERARQVEVQISASTLSGERASALKVADQSPALRVVRRYRNAADKLYEVSVTDHPADRISYTLRLDPDSDGAGTGD